MASDPDSLVIAQLREMRATLAGHATRFDRMDERFTQIDEQFEQIHKRFDDFHDLINNALANQMKVPELEVRHDLPEARQRRFDERFDVIERRLREVEDRTER